MSYSFTSESVSEGHPDKLADQISDAIIDSYLAFDKNSKVACETLVTTNLVVLAGEIKSKSSINGKFFFKLIFLKDKLANYKIPEVILFTTEALPRIASEKIDRVSVKNLLS